MYLLCVCVIHKGCVGDTRGMCVCVCDTWGAWYMRGACVIHEVLQGAGSGQSPISLNLVVVLLPGGSCSIFGPTALLPWHP